MTCGGVVRRYFELFNHCQWHIVVFGAGHVAQAVVRGLLTIDCHVTCMDPRADWLSRLPASPRLTATQVADLPAEVDRLDDQAFVLCLTMGHRSDRPILQRIFESGRQFPYLGVIGSRAKRKVLVRELREGGIDPEQAERFECPLGLPLGNNQPGEIAISIIAQLLQRRDAWLEVSAPPSITTEKGSHP
jgi:xanthine dehydrogenase accessory factor